MRRDGRTRQELGHFVAKCVAVVIEQMIALRPATKGAIHDLVEKRRNDSWLRGEGGQFQVVLFC